MRVRLPVIIALACGALVGCGGGSLGGEPAIRFSCDYPVLAKADRRLGLDFLNPAEDGDFAASAAHAERLGAEFIALHLAWSALEPTPEGYVDPDATLATMQAFLEASDLGLALTLRPIDLTGKTVPGDLAGLRFNDPALIGRFQALLDHVFAIVDHRRLTSLQIGNEIDGYDTSGEHPDFWSDYGAFLSAINGYVDLHYPGLDVGYTATWDGLTTGALADAGVFTALQGSVDLLGVTYYPLNPDFSVRAPADVHADLALLAQRYPAGSLFLQEVGYPTAAANASGEDAQARFYCELFKAWDDQPRIGLLNLVRLQDLSQAEAQALAGPYGLSSEAFVGYLRTLGLRSHPGSGADKPAFAVVAGEAAERGW